MLKKIIHKLARDHHPWRHMKFDELAEIYASMSIRALGFGIIGIFVPVYLYQQGVSIQSLFLFFALMFAFRLPLAPLVAKLLGRIGPKHSIAVSTVLIVGFLMQLLTYEMILWPLPFLALTYSLSNTIFFMAYNTDFSKVQHKDHGGKELGWLYIFEKSGGAIGPFVGGIIATVFSPQISIWFAMAVLLCSLAPLFLSKEPVKTHQHIRFKGFPMRKHARDFIAIAAYNSQNTSSLVCWPLFIAIFVFTDDTYAKLGSLIAVSVVISLVCARMFGRFVDSRRGAALLQFGTYMHIMQNILRSFSINPVAATAVSTLGEPTELAIRLPIVRGYFDQAGSEEGYRIVYLMWGEIWAAVAKSLIFLTLYLFSFGFDDGSVLRYQFIPVGLLSLFLLVQRFPALKKV